VSNELPRSFKLVTVWLLLGVLVFVAIQWWMYRARQTQFQVSGGVVELRRAGARPAR
jgi:aspartyl protease family protein